MILPTLIQVQHAAAVTSEVLGAVYAICTAIGNPLSRLTTGKLSVLGHAVLAFGADIQKAQKRITELFSSSGNS